MDNEAHILKVHAQLRSAVQSLSQAYHLRIQHAEDVEVDPKEIQGIVRDNKAMRLMRDGVQHRIDSITFHVMLMLNTNRAVVKNVEATAMTADAKRHLRDASFQQTYLFDDIVFNLIAALDYVGNTIGFILYGPNFKKVKWGRIRKFAADEEFERRKTGAALLGPTGLSSLIVDAHKTWARNLYDYRSLLIHYEHDEAGGSIQYTLEMEGWPRPPEPVRVVVTAPKKYLKRFPGASQNPEFGSDEIVRVAISLIGVFVTFGTAVVAALISHIEANSQVT